MGNLKAFLKQNKKAKKTTQLAATKSLCDENGDPLLWTIRPLSTKESAAIRDECTIEVPVTGKPGLYRQKVNTDELLRKMICAAVVEPDLHNAEAAGFLWRYERRGTDCGNGRQPGRVR